MRRSIDVGHAQLQPPIGRTFFFIALIETLDREMCEIASAHRRPYSK
jgi:hypothetical protein